MTQALGQWKFCILVNFCLGPSVVCLTQCQPMEDVALGSGTSRSEVLVLPAAWGSDDDGPRKKTKVEGLMTEVSLPQLGDR